MTEQSLGFEALGIDPTITRALDEMGFEEPSPIQAAAVPHLLEGADLIGQAQTGTGKTAAFAIPLLQRLRPDVNRPQALVLVLTRELALQVAEEIAKIGKHLRVRELAVYGGSPIDRQIRVLDMGFIDDIETVISHLPDDRQTVCFSATMPAPILNITKRYMKAPVQVSIARQELSAPTIEQAYFEIRERDKVDALTRIVDHEAISRGIVFCRTKRGCDELASALQARGYLVEATHGDLNQVQRNRVLTRFKEGQIELLIATDVAARGIDVENVSHVINYDIAQSPESHVHRIGRTGRMGREGVAFTLIHPREFRYLKLIERVTRARIARRDVPTVTDVAERALDLLGERISALVAHGAGQDPRYAGVAAHLLDEHDPQHLVAALVSAMAEQRGGAGPEAGPAGRSVVQGKDDFPETGAERGYVRLFMNVGARDRVTPADFVRTIAREADIAGGLIGAIDIHDSFTFVEVPREVGHTVMAAMQHASIQGRSLHIEPARPAH